MLKTGIINKGITLTNKYGINTHGGGAIVKIIQKVKKANKQ